VPTTCKTKSGKFTSVALHSLKKNGFLSGRLVRKAAINPLRRDTLTLPFTSSTSKSLKRGLQPTRAASAGKNPQWAIRARSGHQPAKPRCAHFTTHLIIATPIPPQGTNKRLNAGTASSPSAPHGTDKRRKAVHLFLRHRQVPHISWYTPSSSPPQGAYMRLHSTDPLSANRPAFGPLAAGAASPSQQSKLRAKRTSTRCAATPLTSPFLHH